MNEENAIRLDPAVDAAKRLVARLNSKELAVDGQTNDDIIQVVMVILQLAGHRIVNKI